MTTWQAVRSEVLSRIRSGEWAPGALIPTEHDLARQLGCARATVNRALRELAESGILQRRRKVGTRVTAHASRRQRIALPAIRDEITALGARLTFVLNDYAILRPPSAVRKALHLTPEMSVVRVVTTYLADDRPHCSEVIWFNQAALPAFGRASFEAEPPHEWLARTVPVTQARFSITALPICDAAAEGLRIAAGTPVLTIDRTNLLNDEPVSNAQQYYPPHYRLDMDD